MWMSSHSLFPDISVLQMRTAAPSNAPPPRTWTEPLASPPIHWLSLWCTLLKKKKRRQRPKPTNSLTCIRNNKMSSLSEAVLQHAGANPVVGLNSLDGAGNTVKTNLTWIITSVGYLCLPFLGLVLFPLSQQSTFFIPFSHPLVLMPDFCPSVTNYMPTLIYKDGYRKFRGLVCCLWQAFSRSKTPPFFTFSCM